MFSQFGLLMKSAAVLSGWQLTLLTGGTIILATLVLGAIAVILIRMMNSKEVNYASASSSSEEKAEEIREEQEQPAAQPAVEYDDYPYYEGDPIATSRCHDLYKSKSKLPPPLKLREPSNKIKLLQLKLFFNREERPARERQAPPKLVHLTLDRPRPPGRLTRRR